MIRFDFHAGHASVTYRVVGFTPTPGRAHRFGPREYGPDGVPVAVLIDGVRYPVEPVPFSPTLLRRDYTRPTGGYYRKLAGGELEVRVPERWDRVYLDLFSLAPGEVDVLIDVLVEARRVIASRPPRTPRPLGPGPIHRAVWNETDGRPTASAYVAWIVREELNPWGVWPNIMPRHLSQGDTRWFGPPRELESSGAIRRRRRAELRAELDALAAVRDAADPESDLYRARKNRALHLATHLYRHADPLRADPGTCSKCARTAARLNEAGS